MLAGTNGKLLIMNGESMSVQPLVSSALQSVSTRRFLAHYNLSLRYWDMGEGQCLGGADPCASDPCGEQYAQRYTEGSVQGVESRNPHDKMQQHSLQEAVQRAPEAIGPNYDLGIHFFDKRMMRRAEAKAPLALQLVEKDRLILQASVDDNLCGPPPVDSKKARMKISPAELIAFREADRMLRLLEDV
ncbi:hypothetical protein AK812_SmicGene2249 [Symbiodinium microadriaticum]|uniref:Uncharacterized protein n=1 Tax=Symbiodinium microadriaticum TaxID=2951 RepID=A0A1Q9F1W5_SYMMI|nr:hypothetical protein AK812_SmicGene2249 [Symbiodinium microadriaticum]